MKLLEHIDKLRKAELQEYFIRWFPSEEMTSNRDTLVERLLGAMSDPKRVRDRFNRLSKSSQDFLISLMTCGKYRGTIEEIRQTPRGKTIEPYEVESLVKSLIAEGWVVPLSEARNGSRVDVYVLPAEIGEGLSVTVDVEYRDAQVMLSLSSFLKDQGERKKLDKKSFEVLTDAAAIAERIREIKDPKLREIVETTMEHRGGILSLSTWKTSDEGAGDHLHQKSWREELEKLHLGTTGVLSLKGHGLELEEECLVIFQELVESYSRERLGHAAKENDREFSVGVDLLIDLHRMLEIARSESLEVTREGTVFKKTEERIAEELVTNGLRELFEGSPVHHVIGLCKRLRLLDQGDHYLRTDPMRRKMWLKKKLTAMVRGIFDLYQNDFRGGRWSFHQRMIRDIFLEELLSRPVEDWIPARVLTTTVVAKFLHNLETHEVEKTFRDLQTEEFHHETLVVPLERLHQDLSYWVVHRLALVGLVDLGFRDGNFNALKLSSLGCRFFKQKAPFEDEGSLVVNPDFEVLVFPGTRFNEEACYTLGSFADRVGSELVKRYRITPESVKRGVISGTAADDVLKFLEDGSKNSIPSNVTFSIREWAEGIEPILKQRVLLLKSQTEAGANQVAKILSTQDIPHERIGERSVVVRGVRNERKIRDVQEAFQNAGLILE